MTKQIGETQMSLFLNAHDKNPRLVSIDEVYRLITSDMYRESTEKYRYFRSQHLDRDAEQMKRLSACVVTAGICRGGHKLVGNLVRYTGIVMSDFDNIPAERLDTLLGLLSSDPYVLLAYTTISGCGLRVIYRTDVADVRFHAQAHAQGNAYFARLLGCPFDAKCKDPMRMSYLCHDQKALYHPDAETMAVNISKPVAKPVGRPHKVHYAALSDAAEAVRSELDRQGKCYTEGRYNEYVSSALYLMNAYGVNRQEAFEWVIDTFPDYDTAQLRSITNSVYLHTEEHGVCKLPKEKSGGSRFAPLADLEAFILQQAKIRYNIILGRREISWSDNQAGYKDLSDIDEGTLWSRANKAGLNTLQSTVKGLLCSEFVPEYNPLTDYIASCPEWDGVTDYIALVASMIHTGNPQEFLLYFRKWFVGTVASVFDPDSVNHTILTLLGEQGIYKTTFFNRLLPPYLQRYFYTKVNSGILTKDDRLLLSEAMMVCLEEIDSMRPSELNQLKAMVTMVATNDRAAYAHNREYRAHVASFCATGNNRLFLTDDSGNRRWLPFWVSSIDNPFTTPIPYEGLYAQAYALYRSGFCCWFTDAEIKQLNDHNREYEEPNIEEELILSRFRQPYPGEAGVFISTAEIMERVGTMIRYNLSKIRIYRAMDKLGFPKMRTKYSRGFRVMVLTPEEVAGRKDIREIESNSENQGVIF